MSEGNGRSRLVLARVAALFRLEATSGPPANIFEEGWCHDFIGRSRCVPLKYPDLDGTVTGCW